MPHRVTQPPRSECGTNPGARSARMFNLRQEQHTSCYGVLGIEPTTTICNPDAPDAAVPRHSAHQPAVATPIVQRSPHRFGRGTGVPTVIATRADRIMLGVLSAGLLTSAAGDDRRHGRFALGHSRVCGVGSAAERARAGAGDRSIYRAEVRLSPYRIVTQWLLRSHFASELRVN
jgi:hypothetical protein